MVSVQRRPGLEPARSLRETKPPLPSDHLMRVLMSTYTQVKGLIGTSLIAPVGVIGQLKICAFQR